jgi:hypothetical protein
VVDAFVLTRVQKSIDWSPFAEKELYKYVPKNKVTFGTPSQFRKWYNAREGVIDQV